MTGRQQFWLGMLLILVVAGYCLLLWHHVRIDPYLEVFNFSGQAITVIQDGESQPLGLPVRIPTGESRTFPYYGVHRLDHSGLLLQAPGQQWFYSAYPFQQGFFQSGNDYPVVPDRYQTKIKPYGFTSGFGERVGVDETGALYLIAKGTSDLSANRSSQPPGYPIRPQ